MLYYNHKANTTTQQAQHGRTGGSSSKPARMSDSTGSRRPESCIKPIGEAARLQIKTDQDRVSPTRQGNHTTQGHRPEGMETMTVRIIEDTENGRKWEIIKHEEDRYSVKYYEYYKAIGWRCISTDRGYTKDCVEWEFSTTVA